MRHVRVGTPVAAAFLAALVGCSSATTLEQAATGNECAKCHGFPPQTITSTGAAHPTLPADATATACNPCHSGTVDASGNIIVGGDHMNGSADASIAHPMPFVADHPPAALAGIQACGACHGSDYSGGSANVSCNGCHAGISASGPDWKTNCTFCHGARTAGVTAANADFRAAPPETVTGTDGQTSANPKVGAHQRHLGQGSTLSNGVPCGSCHAVPTEAQALTHFTGDGAPGAISFSAVATKGAAGAAYTSLTCNVYCHGSGTEFTNAAGQKSPEWTSTGTAICGTCHDTPPASGPTISAKTAHEFHVIDRGLSCSICHPLPPGQRALHVNGVKDVVVQASGGPVTITDGWSCTTCHTALGIPPGHATSFVAQHTSFALADIQSCKGCHGATYGGGIGPSCNACHQTLGYADWQTNCTFCHGTRTTGYAGTPVWVPAPPQSVVVTADQTTANPRIGAHQKHLGNASTLSNGIACTECHPAATDLGHIGGSGRAQVQFPGPLATANGAPASMTGLTCSNYCHGATTPGSQPAPTWAPPTTMTCGSCHETTPTTGQHPSQNGEHSSFSCATCHGTGFVAGTSVDKALHVDGAINKAASLNWLDSPKSCAPTCHPVDSRRKNW